MIRNPPAQLDIPAPEAGQPVFVIANNKAEGSAPLTRVKLAAAIVYQPVR